MAAGKGRKLVIVESPAKAKTIAGYLGEGYDVEASVGHIRDLPQPSELPADMKKGPFGKFAVDVDNGFEPYYVVDADKKKKVAELKGCSRTPTSSTWPPMRTARARRSPGTCSRCSSPRSRSSAWCSTRSPARRSSGAANDTRDLDDRLVDAQETRRILDRLYGYEVVPVLWRKVRQGCRPAACSPWRRGSWSSASGSAWRSVRPSYWDIVGNFAPADGRSEPSRRG